MNPTDPRLDEFPEDTRSVRALTEAFRAHADAFEPGPLPDFAGPAPAGRHAPWRAMAVAAAVTLIAGAAAYGVTRGGDTPDPPPTKQSEAPTVTPGWHWESTRDLAVQVPDTWAYAPVPGGGSFCRPGGADRPPFVDQFPTTPLERGTSCFGQEVSEMSPEGIPESLWGPYIVLGPKPASGEQAQADGTYTLDGWTRVVRTIGDGRITLLYDEDHLGDAARILDTARQLTTTDPAGCDVSSPIQSRTWTRPEQVDLAGLTAIEGMAVCQYDTNAAAGTPGLLASFRIGPDRASEVVGAIDRAPAAPPVEDSCVGAPASEAIVLRVFAADGVHDVHFGYRFCRGGFDDGRTVHAISADDCSGLFGGRLLWSGGLEEQSQMCAP